jgi:hypothetical protein
MKDLSLNEMLRYFIIGVFIVVLLYFQADKCKLKEHLDLLSNGDVFGIFSFISLSIGTIQYVTYRAIFFPIINWIITKSMHKKFEREFPYIDGSITDYMDLKRWNLPEGPVKNALTEWASQVHFLYNLFIGIISVWIISLISDSIKQNNWLIFFFLLILVFAVVHHIRYKNKEIKSLK